MLRFLFPESQNALQKKKKKRAVDNVASDDDSTAVSCNEHFIQSFNFSDAPYCEK